MAIEHKITMYRRADHVLELDISVTDPDVDLTEGDLHFQFFEGEYTGTKRNVFSKGEVLFEVANAAITIADEHNAEIPIDGDDTADIEPGTYYGSVARPDVGARGMFTFLIITLKDPDVPEVA